MAVQTHDPYHLIVLPGDDTPEPQGVPTPPRGTSVPATTSAVEAQAESKSSVSELEPGMACRTPQGHCVRIMQILRAEPSSEQTAEVHLLRNPRMSGEMHLSDLTPTPVKVSEGDKVLLHIGDLGMPLQARVVQVNGDYADFFFPAWNEVFSGHTAHVFSISPRTRR